MSEEKKPKGSGYFAAICGGFFVVAFVCSFVFTVNQLSPNWIMRAWFLFVAAILLWWGVDRARTGRPDPTVGQSTINMVITLVVATFGLLSLLFKKP
jgi:hypothetical protein